MSTPFLATITNIVTGAKSVVLVDPVAAGALPGHDLPGGPGGYPGHGLPQPPVDPGWGGGWGRPDRPGHELPPLPPDMAHPGHPLPLPPHRPDNSLPIYPGTPDHELPPPGVIWPPLPPQIPQGKAIALVAISGVGYRWTVIDTSLTVGYPLPPTMPPHPPLTPGHPLPPYAEPK